MPIATQLIPEVARDSQFVLTLLDLDIDPGSTTGALTNTPTVAAQQLSRQVDGGGLQTAYGHIAEADLMLRMNEENVIAADALFANWVDTFLDWEIGLLGVRRIGQNLGLGAAGQWPNPLTEVFYQYLNAAWGNPNLKQRRVQLVFTTFDRTGTWIGKISGHTWRYRRAENNDNLVIKCVDIGGPNPKWEQNS